ncbi:MAG: hypothetical protein OXN88_13195 [Chloroflexota bacterium]|nr:hypothetical protein [Chloroflexota bacterium]
MLRSQMFKSGLSALLVALALIPALLFAFNGQFSRMFRDDGCHIRWGRDRGAWDNMLAQREAWNGAYGDFFLHGLFGPLDQHIVQILPLVSLLIWLGAVAWLIWQALGYFRLQHGRWAIAFIAAGLILAATIHAFYTLEVFYWYSANVRYFLPLVLFTLFVSTALSLSKLLNSRRRCATAAIASAVFCFMVAGFSEMYLVEQGLMLLILLSVTYLLAQHPCRRPLSLMLIAGLAGTIASAAIMLSAPGVGIRLDATVVTFDPVRALPRLIDLSFHRARLFLIDHDAFAAFILLFAVGLLLGQWLNADRCKNSELKRIRISPLPLAIGLAVQLCFLPYLSAHTSNDAQFLDRYSLAYTSVIGVNLALIFGYLALLWLRRKTPELSLDAGNRLVSFAGLILLLAFAFFLITQFRDTHYKAEEFLYASSLILIANVSIQLAQSISQKVALRWTLIIVTFFVAAILSGLILTLISFYSLGYMSSRYIVPVIYFQVAAGLTWGTLLGLSLKCTPRQNTSRSPIFRLLKFVPLLIALVIAINIAAAQIRWLPKLQTFATEWDERHQYIIDQRDDGQRHIKIWPLSYHMANEFWNASGPNSGKLGMRCLAKYFRVESIEIVDP